jgi:hypothetical protein
MNTTRTARDTSAIDGAAAADPPPGARSPAEIQAQIAELTKRWPPHSVPAAMLQRLDELEEELDAALRSAPAADRHA